jgi:hypothetical protein
MRVLSKKRQLIKRKEYMMFNKRSCLCRRVIVFLLFVLVSIAMGDDIVLVNPSFESDYDGWKVINPGNYIGTRAGGGQWWEPYAVSEISPDGTAPDGDWYLMWYDSGVYQIANQTIDEDDMFYVSVDACQSWNAVIVKVDLGYEASKNNYIVEKSETFYPVRRLEMMNDGSLLYVGTWERFYLDYVPSGAAIGKPFYIKIGNEDVGEWLAIDNVQLGTYKDYAIPIYPPDRGEDIPVDAVLQWTLEEGYTCDVWFGTHRDPNFMMNDMVVDNSTQTSHDPFYDEDMELDTTYYWRVDAKEPNGFTHAGKIWSFTTLSLTPVVVDGPYSQTADIVTLEVEAAGIGELTYDWYKVGEPDTLYATTTEPSIDIDVGSDIGLEGYYYCTVSNEHGTSEPSAIARVMQPRLVGWWKFESDTVDSVGEAVAGAPAHDGSGIPDGYVAGIDEGEAAYFTGIGKTVTITDSGEYYNFYPEGLTAIAWVKCELDGTWDGIVGKQSNAGDWWVVGWSLGVNDATSSRLNFSIRNPWTDVYGNPDDGDINDGEWHLVAGTIVPNYSEKTCQMRVYVDGALRDVSWDLDMASVLKTSAYDVVVGRIVQEDDISDGSFHGAIDDLRIYNYALEEMDIAMMYLEHNEGMTVCVDQNEPWRQFDVVGEPGEPSFCKVDIEDFAEFASAWMKCNLLKECLQLY